MFKFYNKHKRLNHTAHEIYGSIVAQSRQPVFYADWNVPDTLEGRFEVLVVHMSLFIHRMKHSHKDGEALGQRVAEVFIDDIDGSFREMGVGDLAVPKHMKAASEAYLGRLLAYSAAFDGGCEDELQAVILRNIGGIDNSKALDIEKMAGYMTRSAAILSAQGIDEISSGTVKFAEF